MSDLQKAIAVDFDGCICTNAWPEIGEPYPDIINRLRREQEAGAGLILWTCREGQALQEAVDACALWGLHFDAINESLPSWIERFGTRPRKVGATEYWDDRAVAARKGRTLAWVGTQELNCVISKPYQMMVGDEFTPIAENPARGSDK